MFSALLATPVSDICGFCFLITVGVAAILFFGVKPDLTGFVHGDFFLLLLFLLAVEDTQKDGLGIPDL